jgi:hypothetical protein
MIYLSQVAGSHNLPIIFGNDYGTLNFNGTVGGPFTPYYVAKKG